MQVSIVQIPIAVFSKYLFSLPGVFFACSVFLKFRFYPCTRLSRSPSAEAFQGNFIRSYTGSIFVKFFWPWSTASEAGWIPHIHTLPLSVLTILGDTQENSHKSNDHFFDSSDR